ncbi:single-stranded-DNA-specific exonuclease RecJ [Candidatus Parcubacteria bacterium]|nr:single-stranded-DNA-specific exonuclease RecJ [Candidatus Parcubacteria bacterium]
MRIMPFPEIFASLLASRGIAPEGKEAFLNPSYESLHDPLLLPDMERARNRVIEAVRSSERIAVFGDYDGDGIPATALMADFFRRAGHKNIEFYIPHRHDEGFGLNTDAMKELAERGATLLITLDCGTADIGEVRLAKGLGMDVIITDHHEPKEELPEAYAIVNPKLKGSAYPFDSLCGCGVAFKLVQAVLAKERFGIPLGQEKWLLDLVGIATLSDMVPLVGENRILARFGLEVLRKTRRPGLLALLRNLNINPSYLTEDDITFMITPRINAASRMGEPEDAFKLLSTDKGIEAERLAAHLEKINQERKGLVGSLVKAAKHELGKREAIRDVIVIGNPEWRPGLLGLVCANLVDEYQRPAFVWGRDGDGVLKGSCRSYNGYDLFALMSAVPRSFIEFGGHKGAGGFSITLEEVGVLEEKLSAALGTLTSPNPLLGKERVLPISLNEVGEDLWKTVAQFAPFGTGNEKPVFKISNAPFGKEENHLEIMLGNGIKAISFFSSPESYKLKTDSPSCTLHAHLEKSYFRNRPEVRLRIVDIEA